MGLIHADPEFIAGTVAAEDTAAAMRYRPAVSSREVQLMTECAELRTLADKMAAKVADLGEQLRTLKGDNATPQRGCQFYTACVGEATVLCEYEYSAAEDPIYDADHPGVGPGHDAELALIQVLINGQWCDPADFMSEAQIERIEQQILESME